MRLALHLRLLLHKRGTASLVRKREHIAKNTTMLLLCCSLSLMSQSSTHTDSWESRPLESPSVKRHLLGCAGDQVFRERLRDRSLLRIVIVFFLVATDIIFVFLFGSSSSWWTFEGRHCEHLSASCGPRIQATHYDD
jgi:hypothetical protein